MKRALSENINSAYNVLYSILDFIVEFWYMHGIIESLCCIILRGFSSKK